MFFRYKIKFYNNNNESKELVGIAFGENVQRALENLYSYYGEDIEDIMCFRCIDDCHCMELSIKDESILDKVENAAIF